MRSRLTANPLRTFSGTNGDPLAEAIELTKGLKLPHSRPVSADLFPTATAQRWDPAEAVRVLLAEEAAGRDRAKELPGATEDISMAASGANSRPPTGERNGHRQHSRPGANRYRGKASAAGRIHGDRAGQSPRCSMSVARRRRCSTNCDTDQPIHGDLPSAAEVRSSDS